MKAPTVTDILAEVQRATERLPDKDGFTTRDLGAETGWGPGKTRDAIRSLIVQGKVEPARLGRRSALTGRVASVDGYRWVRSQNGKDSARKGKR